MLKVKHTPLGGEAIIFDNRINDKIGEIKLYITRTLSYLGIVNFLLLFATFKSVYNVQISLFILIPSGLFFAIVIGYLDYKFIFQYELKHTNKVNDIKKGLDEIKEMLGDKK